MTIQAPKQLILDLTKKCNLSCFMCNTHAKKDGWAYQTMSGEVFEKLIPIFPQVELITLGGCGEPFLDPDIFSRLTTIRRLNPKVYIEVFTNVTLLRDPEKIERAINTIDKFQFSINAFSPKTYESIMIGSRFDVLRNNLALFSRIRKKSRRRLQVTAEFIVMRRNIDDLQPGIAFCKEFGIDSLVLKPLWIFDDQTRGEFVNPEGDEDRPRLESALTSTESAGHANGIEVNIYHELRQLYSLPYLNRTWAESLRLKLARWFHPLPKQPKPVQAGLPPGIPCSDPWTTAQIFDDGWVYLCCQGVTEVGNLAHDSFDEVWNGVEANAYRQGMMSGQYYKACKTCNRVAPSTLESYEKA